MSNTYTQIHIQIIFAVQYRRAIIDRIKKIIFMDEYKSFLKAYDVEFDERYILREPE